MNNATDIITTILEAIAAIVFALLAIGTDQIPTPTDVVPAPIMQDELPPCTHEDSKGVLVNGVPTPCEWVNSERGDGIGFDFIAYPDGSVEYTAAHFPPCPFQSPMTTPEPVLTGEFTTACQFDGWVWTSPTYQRAEICARLNTCNTQVSESPPSATVGGTVVSENPPSKTEMYSSIATTTD